VLIVDDNETNRRVFREQLRAWSCLTVEADSAALGLSLLEQSIGSDEMFDMALVDFQMPGMDGAHFAHQVRTREELNNVRLILVTSLPQQGDAKALKDDGFEGFLTKPIKQQALYQTLAIIRGLPQETVASVPLITVDSVRVAPSKPARLLVAEDNRVNQRLITKLLEKEGCVCEVVTNGQEALEAVRESSYDLILMDCQMPVMDGFSATRQILAEFPDAPPIIALTAGVTAQERQECEDAGMQDFVAKPIKVERLRECLVKFLSSNSGSGGRLFEHHPLLNPQRLREITGRDPLAERELLVSFAQSLDELSQELLSQLADGITPEACLPAHTLKVKALHVGAIRLARMCEAT